MLRSGGGVHPWSGGLFPSLAAGGAAVAVAPRMFEEEGSEIYLKPAFLYFDTFPITVNFADMIGIARRRDEVCIGFKCKALESDDERNNGVQRIPEKPTEFEVQREDCLIVLAEDEL